MGGEQSSTGSTGTDLGIGFGAGQGLLGLYGAVSQNERISQVMNTNADAAEAEYAQIDNAATLEMKKRHIDVHRARSRLRVLAGDSGLDFGGSFAVLDRAAGIDEQINNAIIQENAQATKRRIASGLAADFARAQAGAMNPLSTALQGGLSGFSTGLQIGNGIDRARDAQRQQAAIANAAASTGIDYSGMGGEIPDNPMVNYA